MVHTVTLLPEKQNISVESGTNLLAALRTCGLSPDAPCGGSGKCGKCRVWVDDEERLACQTEVHRDMTVLLPQQVQMPIMTQSATTSALSKSEGYALAVDIGTTTVAVWLLEGTSGSEIACASAPNLQRPWGADVISRIRHARAGESGALTAAIQKCLQTLTEEVCRKAGICLSNLRHICVVGNPAMQQLFLGISVDNLAQIPFSPVLTEAQTVSAEPYFPGCTQGKMEIVPDISGYVGADTVAGVLATKLHEEERFTLLVDIGTNGEMVLGNRDAMYACATAAGPALEGAGITFGMTAATGAIDHVWLEEGQIRFSVIGNVDAVGICGSALVDAIAVLLESGLLDKRGNLPTQQKRFYLTPNVYLTQDDIRQFQLAKGAIAAGIRLLAAKAGLSLVQISRVYLAGAFGSVLDAQNACRTGLLPQELADRIVAVGNVAGGGAKIMACDPEMLKTAEVLARTIQFVELASLPGFRRCFAEEMRFYD